VGGASAFASNWQSVPVIVIWWYTDTILLVKRVTVNPAWCQVTFTQIPTLFKQRRMENVSPTRNNWNCWRSCQLLMKKMLIGA